MPERQVQVIHDLILCCRDLAEQGFAPASSGNVSVRTIRGIWITRGGADLKRLTLEDFILVDGSGRTVSESQADPSKELFLHLAVYRSRPNSQVVLHLHPPHTIAAGTLAPESLTDLPVMVPTYLMRVKGARLVPYFPPGDAGLAETVGLAARECQMIILRNHGLVCSGNTLTEARQAIEETEFNAKIYLLSGGQGRSLAESECERLRAQYWK